MGGHSGSSDRAWDTGMGEGHQMSGKMSCKKWSELDFEVCVGVHQNDK